MKPVYEDIDKIIPKGELIRGFANQSSLSKGDLKNYFRNRGVFFGTPDKEHMVPCLTRILLSPSEFDTLRECLNNREDNSKKSSSRIQSNSTKTIIDSISSDINFEELLPVEKNFNLKKEPQITTLDSNPNKVKIEYEIVRDDMNKGWYESKNEFSGSLIIEKLDNDQIQITKSYTSSESETAGHSFQKSLINNFKKQGVVSRENKLEKILFRDFKNEHRFIFFARLSTIIENKHLRFKEIVDMELRPDHGVHLPEDIYWMENKTRLGLKGKEVHKTFFFKKQEYHQYLELWSINSSYFFEIDTYKGSCEICFNFRDFHKKGFLSEFEINVSSLSFDNPKKINTASKREIKQKLLSEIERQKNDVYYRFKEFLKKQRQ